MLTGHPRDNWSVIPPTQPVVQIGNDPHTSRRLRPRCRHADVIRPVHNRPIRISPMVCITN
eukprot:4815392-Pyramimonas_sp.AAC.1